MGLHASTCDLASVAFGIPELITAKLNMNFTLQLINRFPQVNHAAHALRDL